MKKKFAVLWSLVGHTARRGDVVECDVLGGEDAVKVHLARGAVREATETEISAGKATLDDVAKDARSLEEQLRAERAKNAELSEKHVELNKEVQRLKDGVVEVVRPDASLLAQLEEQKRVIADLQHRIQHGQPLPEEKKKK